MKTETINAYLSENLSITLKRCSDAEKRMITEMFQHYLQEYHKAKEGHLDSSVAANFQWTIQDHIDQGLKEDSVGKTVKCGKGCSFCCYLLVDVNKHEASLIKEWSEYNGVNIDWKKAERLSGETQESWKNLPVAEKRCQFLTKGGECSIYDVRPASCRKHMVITEPELCDTTKPGNMIGKYNNVVAEIIASAMFNATQSGSISKMLMEVK